MSRVVRLAGFTEPLSGFPSLPIGVFWRGRLGEIARMFVDELADRAKQIFGKPEDDRM
jgi:hypothetical protein